MNSIKKYVLVVLGLGLLFSCSREATSSKTFTVETILVGSGPLFEGSNTCQSEIAVDIDKILKDNGLSKEDVVNIKLAEAFVTVDSTMIAIESANLQCFSDNFPMQNVAVANPAKITDGKINFKIADTQEDIASILLEKKSYVVADVTIKEDTEEDLNLPVTLIFSINY